MNYTPKEVREKRDNGDNFLLLDVRTPIEHEMAQLEGSTLIPLQSLPDSLGQLEDWRDKEVVCMCHHGMRSAQAQQILLDAGFSKVINMTGGIDAYSLDVDPNVPRYQ